MGDRINPIKFGPEWLRNLASEPSSSGNPTVPSSSANQGPAVSPNRPNTSTSNAAQGVNTVSASAAPATTSTSTQGQLTSKVLLARLRYGREEMLALYDRDTAEAPEQLKVIDVLYQSRGKPPYALNNTFEDESNETPRNVPSIGSMASGDRYNMPRGRGAPMADGRGRALSAGDNRTSRTRGFLRTTSLGRGGGWHTGGQRNTYSGVPDDDPNQSSRSWNNSSASSSSVRTNSEQQEWNRNKRQNNTNWRQQHNNRDGWEEWRSQNSWGPEKRGQEKWEWDTYSKDKTWNNNRRTWVGGDSNEDALPEWAVENAEACGGTFDSSGAFHGYSNDDTNLPKPQESSHPLTRSHTHGAFARSKTADEGSEEWWASEKAKKLSPKKGYVQLDIHQIQYRKRVSKETPSSKVATSSANTAGVNSTAAINESAIDNASPPADPKDGKSSMEHDKANNKDGVDTQDLAPEPDKKDNIDKEKQDKKIFQTKYPDNNQRQENNTEESHDDKGNLKSVMIPSNNILRQKHQNIGTPTETPTRQQATPNLLQLLEIEKSNQNNKNYDNDVDAQKESETNKLVDDILEMNLEDDLTSLTNKGLPLRIKQSHLSKAIGMGSQNPNAPASTIQPKGMQSNIIQPIGITNNMLNATLGLPIGPSPNLGLPMQGMKQQSMSSSGIANPGMLGGLQGLGGNLQSLNRHPSVLQGGIQAGMPGAMQSAIQGGMQSNIQGGMQSGAHGGMQGSAHGIMQGGAHAGMQSGAHGGMQSGAHGGMQSGAHGGMQSGAHGGMQSGAHGGMQSGAHGGMQSGAHGGMQSGAHGGMLSGAHGGMQGGIQGGMASGMQQGGMPSGMQGSMQSGMQGSMQSGMQGNMQSGMQGNLQGNMQSAMQGNMQSAMQGNMQSAMQANMQSGMQGNMQSAMQGNMQSGMQGGMQSSMQGGMQSSMQVSGLQGGIQNNNMSQQHNHGMQPGGPGFPSGSGAIPGIVTSTVGNNSLFLNQGPNNPMQGSNDISNHGNQQNMFGMHGLQSSASQSAFNSSIYNNLMSNQGGNTMPPIPNMAHFLTLCDQWYYEDPENIIRGPFSSKEMFIWSQAGFFPEMLLVRRACDNGMRPLGVYGLTPFSQIDILPPLGFDRRNQENLLTPQPGLGIDVTNQMVPKNMNNNKLLIMPNNPKTHRNDGGMSNPPQFRAPGPRSPRVGQPRQQMVESLWGQPSQDMLWMQPGNSSRADNRMNNMPLFYWSRQSSAISSNALLPEEITKEMKTEDQILAQLRAQNPPVSQSLSFLGDDAMKKLDDPPFTPSAATTSNLEALEKLIQKDTSRNVNAGVDPIGEQKCDKGKLDLSLEKQLQSKILDNKVIKPVAKPDNDKTIKNKDNGNGKGKGKKTKDDKKDENEVKKEDEMKAEKRSQEPSPSKNKKDEKTSKKDMEKEKKEWIKEGFTIVKGSDKNKDKKKTEEMKAAEEMERKRKEEERIIAIEDEKRRRQQMEVFKRQQEIQQQQSRQSVEMSIKKAPWCTVGNPVSHPTGREAGLSLAEIQRLEREKKLEQMKEQQHMMHILAQQQAAALAREQDVQIGLGWAKKMSSSAAGQSLAEIQAETRKQAAAGAAAVAAAVREEVQPPQPPPIISTPWATTPNGGAHAPNNPIGFWDSTPQNQLAKAEKIPEPPKPVEPPKPAKKKVTVVVPPKKENTHWAEFDAWCTSSLSAWQEANIDVPTFIAFLKDIESPYEVKDYVKVYLGDTKESSEFARQFLERRSRMLRVGMVTPSDDLCSPAIAVNPRTNSGSDYQEVKGKGKKTKKNKMLKVDARILGFSVTASEDRINVGDIDTV